MGAEELELVNLDDDTAGIQATPTSGLETSEAGTSTTFEVVLTSQPLADVTVPLASSNPAEGTVEPESITFTPSNWNAPRTITITGVDDPVADDNQAYTIQLGAATSTDALYSGMVGGEVAVVNLDDDVANFLVTPTSGLETSESGGTATFSVRLLSQPTADVTISVSSSMPTEGIASPTSLTFTPDDWNAPKAVTVTGVDDDVADGTVTYQIVLDSVVTTDPGYALRDPTDVTVDNLDNDTAGVHLPRTTGLETDESGATDVFTIVLLSQPTADVTIAYASSDTGEVTVSPPSPIVFTHEDWNVPKSITVVGVDDPIKDGDQVVAITLSATSTDPMYDGIALPTVQVTNLDDDTAAIRVTPLELVVSEFGDSDTFQVVLTTQPLADVVIPLTRSDDTETSIDKTSLTFTAANWNVPQIVTVTGLDDALIDGQQPSFIRTEPAQSADPAYDTFDADDVLVLNFDDESPGVYVQGNNLKTLEGSNQPSFIRMRLTIAPTAPVTCTVSVSDPSEIMIDSNVFVFDATNYSQLQTITVRSVDDELVDGDQLVTVITHPCTSEDPVYNLFDPRDLPVLNRDNDD